MCREFEGARCSKLAQGMQQTTEIQGWAGAEAGRKSDRSRGTGATVRAMRKGAKWKARSRETAGGDQGWRRESKKK